MPLTQASGYATLPLQIRLFIIVPILKKINQAAGIARIPGIPDKSLRPELKLALSIIVAYQLPSGLAWTWIPVPE